MTKDLKADTESVLALCSNLENVYVYKVLYVGLTIKHFK